MKDVLKKDILYVLGALFLIIVLSVGLYASRFGRALGERFDDVPLPQIQDMELPQKKNIKKITVRRGNDIECIEITPDGAVRIYETCGGDLATAYREENTTAIAQLFNKLARTDFSSYSMPPDDARLAGITVYTVTIETDTGTETFYLFYDESHPSQANDVVKLIDSVAGDEPHPTATATPVATTAPASPDSTNTPTPTVHQGGSTSTVTPTPTGQVSQEDPLKDPFTCVFDDSQVRPYRVSNVVCSTEPLPN